MNRDREYIINFDLPRIFKKTTGMSPSEYRAEAISTSV